MNKKISAFLSLILFLFASYAVPTFAKGATPAAPSSSDTQEVNGYTKKDGTKVAGYTRKKSSKATADADTQEVKGYTKKDGTKVAGYTRKKTSKTSK